jgi:hypothetical protein
MTAGAAKVRAAAKNVKRGGLAAPSALNRVSVNRHNDDFAFHSQFR